MLSTISKRIIFTILAPVLLNGCAQYSETSKCALTGSPYSQLSEDYFDGISYEPEYYFVKENDTLYGISALFGLDYRQLAKWNHIAPPSYTIKAGQKIRLSASVLEKQPKIIE